MAHLRHKLMQLASLGMALMLTAAAAEAPAFRASAAEERIRGDLDGDGALTVQDAIGQLEFLLRPEFGYIEDYDFDLDGQINAKDLTLLKRAILYPPVQEEKAVMLVYMCGSDLESGYGEASDDLSEMRSTRLSDGLEIVVMTGGATDWETRYAGADANYYITINSEGTSSEKQSGSMKYMNDGKTLESFITKAVSEHPANHYGLVMWDHGSGPLYGLCYDEIAENSLTVPDMCSAVKNSGVHFDWIGFDCCLMGSAEVAFMLRDCADYMIGSEESESGLGWDYESFPRAWSEDPGMPVPELAKQIIDDMTDVNTYYKQVSTLACYDLQYAEPLMRSIESYIGDVYQTYKSKGLAAIVSRRAGVLDYGDGEFDMADVKSLITTMALGAGSEAAVLDNMQKLVIYNRTNKIEGCGVTTWFFKNYPSDGAWMLPYVYDGLDFSSTYISQLEAMSRDAYRTYGDTAQEVGRRTVQEVFAALSANHVHVEKD